VSLLLLKFLFPTPFILIRSLVIYEQLLVSDSTIYAIGLAKSFASYTLHVTALSSATGDLLTTIDIPSNIVNGLGDHFPLSHTGVQNPSLVWLEDDTIKYLVLTPKLENKSTSVSSSGYDKILNVGLGDKGIFVARRVDGSSHVLRLESGKVEQTWEFADSVSLLHPSGTKCPHKLQASSNRFTDSLYAGGVDKEGNPYVGRLYWSYSHQVIRIYCEYTKHANLIRGCQPTYLCSAPPRWQRNSDWLHVSLRDESTRNHQSREICVHVMEF
jgi:hypothetical protein